MTYELLFIRGPLKDRTWRIPAKGTLRIGAGKDCEITVPDPAVSRYHCYVEMREGQAWCGDLASDTGLIVNEGVVREGLLPGPRLILTSAGAAREGTRSTVSSGARIGRAGTATVTSFIILTRRDISPALG